MMHITVYVDGFFSFWSILATVSDVLSYYFLPVQTLLSLLLSSPNLSYLESLWFPVDMTYLLLTIVSFADLLAVGCSLYSHLLFLLHVCTLSDILLCIGVDMVRV